MERHVTRRTELHVSDLANAAISRRPMHDRHVATSRNYAIIQDRYSDYPSCKPQQLQNHRKILISLRMPRIAPEGMILIAKT